MVTKIIIPVMSFLIICSFVGAECVSYWECSGWSICDEQTGMNSRTCLDMNECETSTDSPVQMKKCDDDETYEPENPEEDEIQEEIEEQVEQTDMAQDQEEDEENRDDNGTNIYIGYGIILIFIIIGIIIGRLVRKKIKN